MTMPNRAEGYAKRTLHYTALRTTHQTWYSCSGQRGKGQKPAAWQAKTGDHWHSHMHTESNVQKQHQKQQPHVEQRMNICIKLVGLGGCNPRPGVVGGQGASWVGARRCQCKGRGDDCSGGDAPSALQGDPPGSAPGRYEQ
eukprot:EG_transcript_45957